MGCTTCGQKYAGPTLPAPNPPQPPAPPQPQQRQGGAGTITPGRYQITIPANAQKKE